MTGPTIITADPGTDEPIVDASGPSAIVSIDPASAALTDVHLGGLNLTNGASVVVDSLGAPRSLSVVTLLVLGTPDATAAPTFSIDSTSTLDLQDNDLAILYGTGTSPLPQVQEYLQTGSNYDGDTGVFQWNGPGLISSVAAETGGATGLGYAEDSELTAISQAHGHAAVTMFDGQSLGSNAVLVRYTLLGDSTLAGTVDGADYNLVLAGFDNTGDWTQGNSHYGGTYSDGTFTNDDVGGQDYSIVLNNYDNALSDFIGSGVSAPAPTPLLTATTDPSTPQTAIDLSWISTATSGTSASQTYDLYRWAPGDTSFTKLNSTPITATSYTDSNGIAGLTPGTQYFYYLTVDGSNAISPLCAAATPPDGINAAVSTAGTHITLTAEGTAASFTGAVNYNWATLVIPTGCGDPTFTDNNDGSASTTTATVDGYGSYTLQLTVTDNTGNVLDVADVIINVAQVPTLSISPSTATVGAGQSQQFELTANDQFGNAMDTTDATWALASGDDGSIDSTGVYTASSDQADTRTITAHLGTKAVTATVTIPPSTPQLTATEAADGSGINLAWDFNGSAANNDAGFDITRNGNEIADLTGSTTAAYTDTGVSLGNTYVYEIRPWVMVNGTKVFGDYSAPATIALTGAIQATPSTDPLLLAPSESLVATITLPFTDSNTSDTPTASIDWGDGTTDSPDTATATPSAVSGSPGSWTVTFTNPDYAGSSNTATATPGTYTATITLTNGAGVASQFPITIEVGGIPDAPEGVGASTTGGNVTVNWWTNGSDSATSYNIYGTILTGGEATPASDATWTLLDTVAATAGTSSYNDSLTNLTPASSYAFEVEAENDFGPSTTRTGPTSPVESPLAPTAPTDLTATLTGGNVVLTWPASVVDNAGDNTPTGYNIYESTDNGSTFNFFDSVSQDSTSDPAPTTYTATGLTAGTTPRFYITATNASGESTGHSQIAGVPIPGTPGAPTVELLTPNTSPSSTTYDTEAQIQWQSVPDASGYIITRIPDDGSTPTQLPEIASDPNLDPGTTLTYIDTGLSPDVAYSWNVTPVYAASLTTISDGVIDANLGTGSSGGSGGGSSGSGGDTSGGSTSTDPVTTAGSGGSSDSTDDSSESQDQAPDISGPVYNADHTQVTFTWTYQGSVKGFEVEEENKNKQGTNFFNCAGDMGIDHYYSFTANVYPGDDLKFRVRADNSDGTVSPYAGTAAQGGPTAGSSLVYPTNSIPDYDDGDRTAPPAMTLDASSTDSSGNSIITATFPNGFESGFVTLYEIKGPPGAQYYYQISDYGEYTTNGQPIPYDVDIDPGAHSVFAVYYSRDDEPQGVGGLSAVSGVVQVKVAGGLQAPGANTATAIMQSDGTDKVSVYWQNTPNNEQNYILSRSVNGGAYQQLAELGADTTSYTDTNIPYNSAGDAEVQYEVVAVGQPDSSPPDPPANTGDGPTTAPTSAPATSQTVGAEQLEVDKVIWHLGTEKNPAAKGWMGVNGFGFQDWISVTGENLQRVQWTQWFTAATTATGYGGTKTATIFGNYEMNNTGPNWDVDGTPDPNSGKILQHLEDNPITSLAADNTSGVAIPVDSHALGPIPFNHVLGGVSYINEASEKCDFKVEFSVVDTSVPGATSRKILKTFYWGYKWSNYSYQMTGAQLTALTGVPQQGVNVCASPNAPGDPSQLITGYGDGVSFPLTVDNSRG